MMIFDTTIEFMIFDAMRIRLRWGDCFQIHMVNTLLETSFIETNFNNVPFGGINCTLWYGTS